MESSLKYHNDKLWLHYQNCSLAEIVGARSGKRERAGERDEGGSNHGGGGMLEINDVGKVGEMSDPFCCSLAFILCKKELLRSTILKISLIYKIRIKTGTIAKVNIF